MMLEVALNFQYIGMSKRKDDLMFCDKCGSALPDGVAFCTTCGSQQKPPLDGLNNVENKENSETRPSEIYTHPQAGISEEPVKKPKKKGILKVLCILVLALIFVSGLTVLGYYTFLPAKSTLLVAEYSSVLKNYNAFDKRVALYEEKFIKPVYESSIDKQSELNLSVDAALLEQVGLPSETIDLVINGLKNISLKYGYASDIKNKKETAVLGFNLQNNPVLTANVFLDDTKFGVGVPELSQKTIVGDLKNLDKLVEVFPDIDPVLVDTYKNMDPWVSKRIYDEVKIDRKDIKTLMMDYSKEIINAIDSDDMSIKRGKETEVLGKELKCQEITIKLDQKAQKQILSSILLKLKDDQNVYDLTAANIIELFDILGENEVYQQMLQDVDIKDSLSKSNYEQAIVDMESSLDETTFPEEITAKVYIKGLDVVKYAFAVTIDASNEDVLFTIEDLSDDLSYDRKYTFSGGMEGESSTVTLLMNNDYDNASDTTDLTVELNVDMDTADNVGNVNLLLTSKEDPDGKSEVNHIVDATVKFDTISYETQQQGDITFALEGTKNRNSKNLIIESDYTGDLGINIPSVLPNPFKIGFATSTETIYGQKVTLPELSEAEVLDIATATQQDYETLMNEIYEKVGALTSMLGSF